MNIIYKNFDNEKYERFSAMLLNSKNKCILVEENGDMHYASITQRIFEIFKSFFGYTNHASTNYVKERVIEFLRSGKATGYVTDDKIARIIRDASPFIKVEGNEKQDIINSITKISSSILQPERVNSTPLSPDSNPVPLSETLTPQPEPLAPAVVALDPPEILPQEEAKDSPIPLPDSSPALKLREPETPPPLSSDFEVQTPPEEPLVETMHPNATASPKDTDAPAPTRSSPTQSLSGRVRQGPPRSKYSLCKVITLVSLGVLFAAAGWSWLRPEQETCSSMLNKLSPLPNDGYAYGRTCDKEGGVFVIREFKHEPPYNMEISTSAKFVMLKDLLKATEDEIKTIEKQHGVTGLFESINSRRESLEKIDPQLSETLTLREMIIPWDQSKLKYAVLSDDEICGLTLQDNTSVNKEQVDFIQTRIQSIISQGKSFTIPLDTRLRFIDVVQRNPELLKKNIKILVDALQMSLDPLRYRLLSDEKFRLLTLDKIQLPLKHYKYIRERALSLLDAQKNEPHVFQTSQDMERFDTCPAMPQDLNQLLVMDLMRLSPETVSQNIKKLPPEALLLHTDEQLKSIQLSSLSDSQINYIINFGGSERVAVLDSSQVQDFLEENKTDELPRFLSQLSVQHWKDLKLSKFIKFQIGKLFDNCGGEEARRRFALINPSEIQAALEADSLYKELLIISDEQYRALKFSKLSNKQISQLFMELSVEDKKHIVSLISPDELEAAIRIYPSISDWR